jgi:hypothetical protein
MSLLDPVVEPASVAHPPAAPDPVPRLPRIWPIGIFLVTLIVYAIFTNQVLIYTNPPTGDQPFYLHTAISIVQDHDINESNNYADQDERQYYPRSVWEDGYYPAGFKGIPAPYPLPPHNGHTTNRPATEQYSKHGLGLSVLIVPGWALGVNLDPASLGLAELDQPTAGWPVVVYQLNILGALLAAQVFLLAYEATRRRGIALVVWLALAFSNPLMTYSYLIFPELPAGLCAIYAFRRLRLGWAANGRLQLLLIGLALGFMPWLHARFLPIMGALALYAIWAWRRARQDSPAGKGTWPRLVMALAPIGISLVLLMDFYYWLYGTVLPNTGDHAGFINPLTDPLGLPVSMVGLLIDQQWGLLIAAPVYLLAFVGMAALWMTPGQRATAGWLLFALIPYYLVVAEYRQWWGEWCPPARYLATIAPLLALPLAQGLLALQRSRLYNVLFGFLAALGWAYMAGLLAHPRSFWNHPSGQSDLFLWVSKEFHLNLVPVFPAIVPWSWDHTAPIKWGLVIGWGAIALVIFLAGLLLLQESRARGAVSRQPSVVSGQG